MAGILGMSEQHRASIETRIMRQLKGLDEARLQELDRWLAQEEPVGSEGRTVTRRRLLALLGGAAVLSAGGAAGSAYYLSEQGGEVVAPAPAAPVPDVAPAPQQVVEDLSGTVAALRSERDALGEQLSATSGLVALYEQLDGVGLDRVVESGLAMVATALGRLSRGSAGLREGLRIAEQRISELDQSFAGLDGGLAAAEGAVTTLSRLMQGLEDRLQAAGEPVAPITEALGGFFRGLIERIPAVGPRILETIERVEEIIGAIPESIENINSQLLRPLRERFFPREGGNVTVRLIDPILGAVVAPADQLLGAIEELGSTWQASLQQPVAEKLEKQADLRQKIQAYRAEQKL